MEHRCIRIEHRRIRHYFLCLQFPCLGVIGELIQVSTNEFRQYRRLIETHRRARARSERSDCSSAVQLNVSGLPTLALVGSEYSLRVRCADTFAIRQSILLDE